MALLVGCYTDNKEDLYQNFPNTCDPGTVSFASTVKPIIDQNCAYAGCHAGTSPAAGLALESYAQIKVIADNGKLVNRLIGVNGNVMPPAGKLPPCEIQTITDWVLQGALNN